MFDFDGTLALFRAGWMTVMLDMMMETLGSLGPDPRFLRDRAEEYVARLTGKDTVYQMAAFAAHVRELGGTPLPAEEYKAEFLRRIERHRAGMMDAVARRTIEPDRLLVPGSRGLLEWLAERRVAVYLASGSAHEDICVEAKLLGIDKYFDGIYGSAPAGLTKRQLLARIVSSGVAADEIFTFGDGRVEIEETKAIGGTAIGVATDERECLSIDPKKRLWLMAAGADDIIPNYLEFQ
jgi:phosphoglycolate phosphatase